MHRVVNTAKGPRFVHARKGTITLDPGKSFTGEFDDAEVAAMGTRAGELVVTEVTDDSPAPEPADEFDAMSDDNLRAHIEQRDGRAPHPNAKRETLLKRARNEAE